LRRKIEKGFRNGFLQGKMTFAWVLESFLFD